MGWAILKVATEGPGKSPNSCAQCGLQAKYDLIIRVDKGSEEMDLDLCPIHWRAEQNLRLTEGEVPVL